MKILAIDTASNHCSLSLWCNQQRVAGITHPMERGHAGTLAPLCKTLLEQSTTKVSEVGQILVNIGPGSFTGIRVGIAFAQGLAQAAQIPLQGITAFEAALSSSSSHCGNILIILDARRNDFYCQLIANGFKHPPSSLTPEGISQLIQTHSPNLLGNGVYSVALALKSVPQPKSIPVSADNLVRAYHMGHSQAAHPFYLRQPDVTRKAC